MTEIIPETEEERRILESEHFLRATEFRLKGKSHLEETIGQHVQSMLGYINSYSLVENRQALRLIALLHDLGKPESRMQERAGGKNHSEISYEISRQFTSSPDVLAVIRHHDDYYRFYKKSLKGRFNPKEFKKRFTGLPMKLLTQFMYCDSNSRETDSIDWFRDQCRTLGVTSPESFKLRLKLGNDCVEYSLEESEIMVCGMFFEAVVQPVYSSFGVYAAKDALPRLIEELQSIKKAVDLQNLCLDQRGEQFRARYHDLMIQINQLNNLKLPDSEYVGEFQKRVIRIVKDYLTPLCDYAALDPSRARFSPTEQLIRISTRHNTTFMGFKVPQGLINDPDDKSEPPHKTFSETEDISNLC